MKKYVYKGEFTPASFTVVDNKVVRVILVRDNEYSLPENNERDTNRSFK